MESCNNCILCEIRKIKGVLSVSGICPPYDNCELTDRSDKFRIFHITTVQDISIGNS